MGLSRSHPQRGDPQGQLPPHARLTPATRRLLVDRIRSQGWPVARAAEAAGVSRQTAYKWLARHAESGDPGLLDRSSRPHRIPIRTPGRLVRRMEQLRRRRKAAWEIALELGVPVSTVSKHLKGLGLGRIWRLVEADDPPLRYERSVSHRRQETRSDRSRGAPHPRRP